MYLRTVCLRINLRLNNIFCYCLNFAFLSLLIIKSSTHKPVSGYLWYIDWGSCELVYATMSPIHLNMSILFNPNSLCLSLLVYIPDHIQCIPIWSLVDSGLIYHFIDSTFAHGYSLSTCFTPPMELYLFDGSLNNIITKIVTLPITFLSSKYMTLDFYITLLDSCCSLVLDYSWLT